MTRLGQKLATVYFHTAEEMREIRHGTAHLVIASPPFTNQSDRKTLDKKNYLEFFRRIASESFRVLVRGGIMVVINTDLRDHARYNRGDTRFDGLVWQKHSDLRHIAERVGFRCFDTKIWAKSLRRNQYRYTFGYIQFFKRPDSQGRRPGRQKVNPVFAADVWVLEGGTQRRDSRGYVFRDAIHPEIVTRCIEQYTAPGDLVVSPFAGSGTILSVARLMGRQCLGYEVDRNLKRLIRESIDRPENFPAYDLRAWTLRER